MLYRTKYLLASTAMMAFMLQAAPSFADTVTTRETVTETPSGTTSWKTEEHSVPAAGARIINFMDFDLVKDGILSINEVGEMLFKLYDTDGNNVIDNVEYERRAVITVMPMEKNTTVFYDFDGDGKTDEVQHTYETFMQDTLLTRFDKNKDGLSPHEFMDMGFLKGDVNNDKVIDLKEWQGSYIPSIDKKNQEKALLNK